MFSCFAVSHVFNSAAAANEVEWMPDENLRRSVREALALAPDALLTPEKLEGLTELHAAQQEIRYLKGLEYATKLEMLNLHKNRVIDITPLSDLTELKQLGSLR